MDKQRDCEQTGWMDGACCLNADLAKDFGGDLMTTKEYMIFRAALNDYGKTFIEIQAADKANQIIQRLINNTQTKRDK